MMKQKSKTSSKQTLPFAPALLVHAAAFLGGYLLIDLLSQQARLLVGHYPNPLFFLIPLYLLAVYGEWLPAFPIHKDTLFPSLH